MSQSEHWSKRTIWRGRFVPGRRPAAIRVRCAAFPCVKFLILTCGVIAGILSASAENRLLIHDASGTPGGNVILPIEAISDSRMAGGQVDILFDPSVLSVVGVNPGSILNGETLRFREMGSGWIRVLLYDRSEKSIGSGVLFGLEFLTAPTAEVGTATPIVSANIVVVGPESSRIAPFVANTGRISILANKTTPIIQWSTPPAITFGTPLTESLLNAIADIPGTFTYVPPIGTTLNAGDGETLSATFTPDDTSHYLEITVLRQIDILPAPLTIRADDKTKLYAAPIPELTASFFDFVNGDTPGNLDTPLMLDTTATPSSPAGSYPIIPSGATDANYLVTFVEGVLAVNRVPLQITADNRAKLFGEPLPMFTATYTGFVNGDAPANLDAPALLTTVATATSPPGVYPIAASGASDPNYEIVFVAGQLTVTLAGGTTLWSEPSRVERSTPTLVTFRIYIPPNPNLQRTSVNLQRQNGTTWSVVGTLYDDGTHGDAAADDNLFTLQVQLNEANAGSISFRGSAAYKGQLARRYSNTLAVQVGPALGPLFIRAGELQLFDVQRDGTTFKVSMETKPGRIYWLESTGELGHPDWKTLESRVGDGGAQVFEDTNADGRQRFYRVRSVQD